MLQVKAYGTLTDNKLIAKAKGVTTSLVSNLIFIFFGNTIATITATTGFTNKKRLIYLYNIYFFIKNITNLFCLFPLLSIYLFIFKTDGSWKLTRCI